MFNYVFLLYRNTCMDIDDLSRFPLGLYVFVASNNDIDMYVVGSGFNAL